MVEAANLAAVVAPVSSEKPKTNGHRKTILAAFPNLAARLPEGTRYEVALVEGRFNGTVTDGDIHDLYHHILQHIEGRRPRAFTYGAVKRHYRGDTRPLFSRALDSIYRFIDRFL